MPYTFTSSSASAQRAFISWPSVTSIKEGGVGKKSLKEARDRGFVFREARPCPPSSCSPLAGCRYWRYLPSYRERPECSWPWPPFSSVTSSLPASDSCWLPAPRVGHREPHSHSLRTHPSTTSEREQAPNACLLLSMSGMTINLLGQVHSDT